MNKSDNVSISSPARAKKLLPDSSAPSSRLYRAPQSTIRRLDSDPILDAPEKLSRARRRRQHSGGLTGTSPMLASPALTVSSARRGSTSKQKKHSHRHLHDHNSSEESSTNSVFESLEVPNLWMDDLEGNLIGINYASAWSSGRVSTPRESRHRKRRNDKYGSADSVVSEHLLYGDEESVYTHRTTHSMYEVQASNVAVSKVGKENHRIRKKSSEAKIAQHQRRWMSLCNRDTHDEKPRNRFVSMTQLAVLLAFVFVAWDSRRRVHEHNHQLQQYDEERAHILEQMTWIDNAAKKVHKKYADYDSLQINPKQKVVRHNDILLRDENKNLKSKLEQLQLRVQQNARDRTVRNFGDKPVQVTLPLTEGDVFGEHIVIALSDDAPHAVSTFLQQVGSGLWDQVDFQRLQNGRVLHASTRFSSTAPVLEFVEKSRGCHHAGSVAVHQLESDDFHVMVLKIHMEETAATDEGDVCIGIVLKGLETLEQIIPQIPVIHSEETGRATYVKPNAAG